MNLEEYKRWLQENGNKEEQKAIEVVQAILRYHKDEKTVDVQFFPHHIIETEKGKLECDLIIELHRRVWNKIKKVKIEVEFKETDIQKVIAQAIARKDYFDYVYIATWSSWLNYLDIFVLSYFGIGWVLWKEKAFLLLPAQQNYNPYRIEEMIDVMINDKLSKYVDKKIMEKLREIEMIRELKGLKKFIKEVRRNDGVESSPDRSKLL